MSQGQPGWLTGAWRSPSGRAYVTNYHSKLLVSDTAGAAWSSEPVPGVVLGVWGLDDEHVFLWGTKSIFLRTPSGVRELPKPPGEIVAMHGVAPDLVFGVGFGGLLCRFDGGAWTRIATGTQNSLGSVFAVSADEVYAGGEKGDLLCASVRGAAPLLRHDGPIRALAHWHGQLWVGADAPRGLSVVDGGTLVSVKPNLTALDLDARGDLVVTTAGAFIGTTDGKAFKGCGVDQVQALIDQHRPMWRVS